MANIIAIMGESGSGKSTSIRNMDPATTFLLNVDGKSLPFKGGKKKYTILSKENPGGNSYITDRVDRMIKILENINNSDRFKNIIIDDVQYIMSNEFMRRASEKGYEKFTEIGKNFYMLIEYCKEMRDDLNIFFLTHTDTLDDGTVKIKTIGKMLDEKVTLEGKFTIVLRTMVEDGKYLLSTQTNGFDRTKSPFGMFSSQKIDNDLTIVIDAIKTYEEEDS